MEELVDAINNLGDKLEKVVDRLDDISIKLNNIDGVYGLDDIISKLDEVNNDIRGETGYNLTDIHSVLSDISININ